MNYEDSTTAKNEMVDKKIAERLLHRIVVVERSNLQSREHNSSKMVDNIIKIIEEELKCF